MNSNLKHFLQEVTQEGGSGDSIFLPELYFNEIGRFLEGKLSASQLLNENQAPLRRFLQPILRYRALMSMSGITDQVTSKQDFDALIHITEKSHLREILPIFHSLKSIRKIAFVTYKISVLRVLQEKGLPFLLPPAEIFSTWRNYNYISGKVRQTPEELFEQLGSDSADYKAINQFLRSRYHRTARQLLWYEQLLKSKPSFAIVGNDLTPEGRLFSRIAKLYDVSTYSIQHGNVYGDWIGSNHIVDYFFTFGATSKEVLESLPYLTSKLVVTGSPFLHKLLSQKDEIQKEAELLWQQFSIKAPYTLIALSGYGHSTSKGHYLSCLESLKRLVEEHARQRFIVKLHPKESIADYEAFKAQQNVILITNKMVPDNWNYSIFTWLHGSEKVITGSSTVALEAMAMSIPVISIDYANEYESVDFRKAGATFNAETHEQLQQVFNLSLEHCKAQIERGLLYSDKYYNNRTGNIIEGIVDFITNNEEIGARKTA
jgi:hypothetical protein